MKTSRFLSLLSRVASLILLTGACSFAHAQSLPKGLKFVPGAVNRVEVTSGESTTIALYAPVSPTTKTVLLPHHRRDVLHVVASQPKDRHQLFAPAAERKLIEAPEQFWKEFVTSRFHDYKQQTTKVLEQRLSVHQWVNDKQELSFGSVAIKVLSTPGFTPGSVSYLSVVDGKRIAFTGDLIYQGGRIFDIYSFQDAIPEANVRGYHGYGSRFAQLMQSLDAIAAWKPDLIVPARGPIIHNPERDIQVLQQRVRELYHNYLSTNALHWYFKKDRMTQCGERVLGKGAKVDLMPYSHHEKSPDWVFEQSTSRVLISDEGHAFLLDCGYQQVIDAVNRLIKMKLVKKVDGIFVTHFHDDHTDMVQKAAEEFQCPVYALEQYADVLENPDDYHLPAMTGNPIKPIKVMKDGQKMKWQEFELTFHFYPGQSYYHGGLFVRKAKKRPIFFVGDSFAPSGMDDYCVLNRNLAHDDDGYLLCLSKLAAIKEPFWIVNEHIPFVFEFSDKEQRYLKQKFQKRIQVLAQLTPWDDPNYAIDEQWSFFKPYLQRVKPGSSFEVSVKLENHSKVSRQFDVSFRSRDCHLQTKSASRKVEGRSQDRVVCKATAPAKKGIYLIRADVKSDKIDVKDWIETMIIVE